MTGRGDVHAAFGRNLAAQRRARGWTQRQAAAVTGIGRATIARVENGLPISFDTAIALASAYGTTVDALLTGTGFPQSATRPRTAAVIPVEVCVACGLPADVCINGARLCRSCASLVETLGGGETGLMTLMRRGPSLARVADESATLDDHGGQL
jgi:DNA-binding XRE family transcriptional regulator